MLEAKLASAPPNDVEDQWNEWKSALQETAQAVLGQKRRHREEWISDDTWTLIKEKKDLKMMMETSASERRSFLEAFIEARRLKLRRRLGGIKERSIIERLTKRRMQRKEVISRPSSS